MQKETFGKLLMILRKKNGLSQKYLAESLSVSISAVSKWENGKNLPDMTMIISIADILQVSCDELHNPEKTLKKLANPEFQIKDVGGDKENADKTEKNEETGAKLKKKKYGRIIRISFLIGILVIVVGIFLIYMAGHRKTAFQQVGTRYIDDPSWGMVYEIAVVVNTKIDKYNLNINTRVFEFIYDGMAEEIEDVTLSNADIGSLKVPNLNSVSKEVENKPDVNEVISITKLESTNILNAGMKNSYVVVRKNEILVMDSPEIDNAVNVWRWNKNGLMHSNSGYNGIYTMGMRYDGVIFADLIKAGILKSLNDKTWINMEDGSFNFADALKLVDGKLVFSHTNGSEGITIDKGGFKVTTYSSTNGMEEVAKLIATSFAKDRNQNGLSICTTGYGDYIQIGYERENGAIRAAMFFVPV